MQLLAIKKSSTNWFVKNAFIASKRVLSSIFRSIQAYKKDFFEQRKCSVFFRQWKYSYFKIILKIQGFLVLQSSKNINDFFCFEWGCYFKIWQLATPLWMHTQAIDRIWFFIVKFAISQRSVLMLIGKTRVI